jgi:hypothetical protein
MTEAELKNNIYTWLKTIVPALYVGDLSARPAGSIVFVWHMLSVTREASPILEGRIAVDTRIGRDTPSSPDVHGSETYTGDREEMLYLHFFGKNSVDYLKSIRNATQDATVRPTVNANGFTVVECHPVLDAHQYLESMPEDGATVDMRIRFIDTWTTESGKPGTIETADMTGKVN